MLLQDTHPPVMHGHPAHRTTPHRSLPYIFRPGKLCEVDVNLPDTTYLCTSREGLRWRQAEREAQLECGRYHTTYMFNGHTNDERIQHICLARDSHFHIKHGLHIPLGVVVRADGDLRRHLAAAAILDLEEQLAMSKRDPAQLMDREADTELDFPR